MGMGQEGMSSSVFRETLALADEILGENLSKLIAEGPSDQLQLTRNCQPAILAVSVAYARLLQERGITCDIVAGHSLGEFSALVIAGAFSFEDALHLTRIRGELMQAAVPVGEGAMAAILGIEDKNTLIKLCEEASQGEIVEPSTYNCPRQMVVSGHTGAVERACGLAKKHGAYAAKRLAVSAPFHCSLLNSAAEGLAEALKRYPPKRPSIPIVPNVSAEVLTAPDGETIASLLVEQVTQPVRWHECVCSMVEFGVMEIIEVGPGSVLTRLVRRIDRKIDAKTVLRVE